jgi:hypothetical protein
MEKQLPEKIFFNSNHWLLEIAKVRQNYSYTINVFTNEILARRIIGSIEIKGADPVLFDFFDEPIDPEWIKSFTVDRYFPNKSIREIKSLAEALVMELEAVDVLGLREATEKAGSLYEPTIFDDATEESRSKISLLQALKAIKENEKNVGLFSNQLIVLSATYCELIIKDFLYLLFLFYPDKMHSFIGHQDNRGSINLKSILGAKSKLALIQELAEEATSTVTTGKNVFKNLRTLTRNPIFELDKDLEKDIICLKKVRNEIVHENRRNIFLVSQDSLNAEKAEVFKALDILENFVMDLVHLAFYLRIPQNSLDYEDIYPGFNPDIDESYKLKELSDWG